MWGAISRLFHKQNGKLEPSNEATIMDKGEAKRLQESEAETFATREVSTLISCYKDIFYSFCIC